MQQSVSAHGQGVLKFADGRTVEVAARLTINRSFFSVSGEGEFQTDSHTATYAFMAEEPLSLKVGEAPPAFIVVREARTMAATARCWFSVHS